MTTLIADSGSTKTQWLLTSEKEAPKPLVLTTRGLNPFHLDDNEIKLILLEELLPQLPSSPIDRIFFYGAGCNEAMQPRMSTLLAHTLNASHVSAHSDMLGAARALCGLNPGIACILGTGSNSCLYDGRQITANTPPLGYILGDEGSGATLGRRLLGNIFKHQLHSHIENDFSNTYHLSMQEVIERVYRQPSPNRFLASFAPFIKSHIGNHELEQMVISEFRSFLIRNVKAYPESNSLPVHFVGSIAHHFAPQLHIAAQAEKMVVGQILKEPIRALGQYHQT